VVSKLSQLGGFGVVALDLGREIGAPLTIDPVVAAFSLLSRHRSHEHFLTR
jgi:hypothetical protein